MLKFNYRKRDNHGCWEFYVLATSNVISGQVPTSDNVYSWGLTSVAPLRNQAINTVTQYPPLSHYPDREPTIPCPILIMLNMWLRSENYKFDKSLVRLDRKWNSLLLIRPRCPCHHLYMLLVMEPVSCGKYKQRHHYTYSGTWIASSTILVIVS